MPALTFVADANAVVLCGATPVLADCASLSDWNVSAETVARAELVARARQEGVERPSRRETDANGKARNGLSPEYRRA